MNIVTMLLPLAIQLITAYLEKGEDKKEAREAFLVFVEKMQSKSNGSAGLRKSYQAQIDRLKKINHGA